MRRSYKTRNGYAPAMGPVAVSVPLAFATLNDKFDLDFTHELMEKEIDFIQSAWVDNGDNPNSLIIQCDQTQQRIIVPPFAQNYVSIIVPGDPRFEVSCKGANAFAGLVRIIFQNIPVPIASSGPIDIGAVNAILSPTVSAVADHSGSIAAGNASQTAIPANAARTRFLIQNPGSSPENIFVNFTNPATAGGDSLELFPGGSYDSAFGPLDQGSVTVTSATTGTKYMAKEWS